MKRNWCWRGMKGIHPSTCTHTHPLHSYTIVTMRGNLGAEKKCHIATYYSRSSYLLLQMTDFLSQLIPQKSLYSLIIIARPKKREWRYEKNMSADASWSYRWQLNSNSTSSTSAFTHSRRCLHDRKALFFLSSSRDPHTVVYLCWPERENIS